MHVPTADELAAIAAAYLAVTRAEPLPAALIPAWRLAARLPDLDAAHARSARRAGSAWKAAARVT